MRTLNAHQPATRSIVNLLVRIDDRLGNVGEAKAQHECACNRMPARNKYCVFKGTRLNLGARGLRMDGATNGKQQQWNDVLYFHNRVSRGPTPALTGGGPS